MKKVLIFRTNIETQKSVEAIQMLFNNQSSIINWSIDLEDIDKVLKVKITDTLNENDVKNLVKVKGFYCEALPD
ncbi:hypothetical protein MWU58_10935 [Flavobacteriaceae bacterium S0825]|uniref:hypothetical protein n=1 Tax=Gaetbulibacter sp. S0825 TaxID=2720084 RepID=UPI00142FC281|nr:hypothetical protein [Gaetbulibacter sp. S0825]MCK0109813.1 hypothetical protein [Flavobacteriaceae bacterium S0825]NIX65442.1 hypothetical protein [Gaetbulibacter sp. S0825]